MMKISFVKSSALLLALLTWSVISAQTITNGDFTSSGTGWACSPETNPQSTYGGTGSNRCAEIDAAAGLCQTISGFTPGAIYRLTFNASRRTGGCPGPNPATINVVISGGALSTTVTRTNTTFAFTGQSHLFTATAASHTLTISAAFTGTTCGFIVDDFVITLFSPLPVEFGGINYTCFNNKKVEFNWYTYSETNNQHFYLKKSNNGYDWTTVSQLNGAGNSNTLNAYSHTINDFDIEYPIYSLSQTDFDGTSKILQTFYVNCIEEESLLLNINQVGNTLIVDLPFESQGDYTVFSSTGQLIASGRKTSNENLIIQLSNWSKGIYFLNFQNVSTFQNQTIKFYLN